jgi:hypothetical protein
MTSPPVFRRHYSAAFESPSLYNPGVLSFLDYRESDLADPYYLIRRNGADDIVIIGIAPAAWVLQRLALDGVRIDRSHNGVLLGVGDPDWNPRPFTIDIRMGEVESDFPFSG